MKIVGVIPARYQSSRFEGKPLADICGKPMVWWVHNQVKQVQGFDEVYVATDDDKIASVCDQYGIKSVMTSPKHKTHIDRLYEFSKIIDADFYVNVNGDEPLIDPLAVQQIIPEDVDSNGIYVANLMTEIRNPLEAVDTSKIKITTDVNGYALYMARYPIPFPKGTYEFTFNKFVGVQCFTKNALAFANQSPRGIIESAEDIDEYRFLENGQKIKFIKVDTITLSVDTPKDLEKVKDIIQKRGNSNE